MLLSQNQCTRLLSMPGLVQIAAEVETGSMAATQGGARFCHLTRSRASRYDGDWLKTIAGNNALRIFCTTVAQPGYYTSLPSIQYHDMLGCRASDLVRLLHRALGTGSSGLMSFYLGPHQQVDPSTVTVGELLHKVVILRY